MAKRTDVIYDCATTWDAKPYRSEALYGADRRAALAAKRGTEVQVIAKHGDATWTDAVLVRWEQIDPELGLIRFVVMINGAEHKVSEDRIRVP